MLTPGQNTNTDELIRIANEMVLKKPPLPLIKDATSHPIFITAIEGHLIQLMEKKKLLLPNFHEHIQTIAVFSDYGGETSTASYQTYSFLFTGYNALYHVLREMRSIREKHGLLEPHKEICFKDMGYGPLNRSLDSWLYLGNYLPGLLFTLIVSKNISSIIGNNEKKFSKELAEALQVYDMGHWKAPMAEKLLRIVHTICYFSGLLSIEGQKIFWMTDDDAIMANADKKKATGMLLSRLLPAYTTKEYGSIGMATPFDDENDGNDGSNISDLLSYPDLVAGSVEAFYSNCFNNEAGVIKDTANKVLLWLCNQGIGLKKLTMSFNCNADGALQTAMVEFHRKEKEINAEYIPIWM